MPEICRFLGIVITMYFDEHNPPHFHIRYNEYRASMEVQTLNVVAGDRGQIQLPLALRVTANDKLRFRERDSLALIRPIQNSQCWHIIPLEC